MHPYRLRIPLVRMRMIAQQYAKRTNPQYSPDRVEVVYGTGRVLTKRP